MPRRTVKIALSYEVVIDNDREGIPWVRDPSELAINGCRSFDGLTEVKNVKATIGLDRASSNELRRRDRVRRVNQR